MSSQSKISNETTAGLTSLFDRVMESDFENLIEVLKYKLNNIKNDLVYNEDNSESDEEEEEEEEEEDDYLHCLEYIKTVEGKKCNVYFSYTNNQLCKRFNKSIYLHLKWGKNLSKFFLIHKINLKKEEFLPTTFAKSLIRVLKLIKYNSILEEFSIEHFTKTAVEKYNGIMEKKELKCCICYENTLYKTKCNHSLCRGCEPQIQGRIKSCPICREKICSVFFSDE
jgi:hypothetical protein